MAIIILSLFTISAAWLLTSDTDARHYVVFATAFLFAFAAL